MSAAPQGPQGVAQGAAPGGAVECDGMWSPRGKGIQTDPPGAPYAHLTANKAMGHKSTHTTGPYGALRGGPGRRGVISTLYPRSIRTAREGPEEGEGDPAI